MCLLLYKEVLLQRLKSCMLRAAILYIPVLPDTSSSLLKQVTIAVCRICPHQCSASS